VTKSIEEEQITKKRKWGAEQAGISRIFQMVVDLNEGSITFSNRYLKLMMVTDTVE